MEDRETISKLKRRHTQPFASYVFSLRLCEKQSFTLEAQSKNLRRKGLSFGFGTSFKKEITPAPPMAMNFF
ncbi:MAG TPA: hypothetical protein VJ715_02700 [Pyrinomonadaceae bacterium]|nr:hypothetical protein [Pyrinomonadaceae bacterium]